MTSGPLRIAHFALGRTNPEAADGIDRTVYHLCRSLAELGHGVRLFSITNKPPIPIPGVTVSTYPSLRAPPIFLGRRLRNLLVWRSPLNLPAELGRDLLAWEPDVLHLHGVHVPQHLRLARVVRRARIPYCVTIHGMLSRGAGARHRWTKRAAAVLERPFLDEAAFLHAVSDREREDFVAAGLRAPVLVAPNGIDLSDLPAPAGVPTAVGPADGRVEFLFLGRLDPEQKGLDLLLDGLARSGLEAASVTLVGPDWRGNRRALEALALKLGIAGRVTFAGAAFGARRLELLSRATVFVQTSRWEGLSFSVLEAAALGRPCLLTPAADPQSRFGPAGAALVVEADGGAIAQGLRCLACMDPTERQALGARARRLVETEFTWPPTARRVAEAYRAHARGLQAS